MTLRQIFSNNLRNARKMAGLSQMRLAERCDTATNYISDIEVCKKFPSVEMVEKIAKALQVQPYLLFLDSQNLWEKSFRKNIPDMLKNEILRQLNKSAQKILQQY
ncbi:MAG: helix-turn-helix transcriptional regulator [Candidatus Margulisbacteria bacterium]|nr:helix-turn-helix transcriptional regulator [Candidatus Margulisiibacteriota bacterium]